MLLYQLALQLVVCPHEFSQLAVAVAQLCLVGIQLQLDRLGAGVGTMAGGGTVGG
jgi:hypothetical protein